MNYGVDLLPVATGTAVPSQKKNDNLAVDALDPAKIVKLADGGNLGVIGSFGALAGADTIRRNAQHQRHKRQYDDVHWRDELWHVLEYPNYNRNAQRWSNAMTFLILVSVVCLCIETEVAARYPENSTQVWFVIDAACVVVFTFEFVLRLAACPNRYLFFFSVLNWVDVVAILPFFIRLICAALNVEAGWLAVFRAARILRLLKIASNSEGFVVVARAIAKSLNTLGLLVFMLSIAAVLTSSIMYFAEKGGENEEWFYSIPNTLWWAIVTMTTVGYGDTYPGTLGGKLVAAITMMCGILILALPVTVIGGNFQTETELRAQAKEVANMADSDGSGVMDIKEIREFWDNQLLRNGVQEHWKGKTVEELMAYYDDDDNGHLTVREFVELVCDTCTDIADPLKPQLLQMCQDVKHVLEAVSGIPQQSPQPQGQQPTLIDLKKSLDQLDQRVGGLEQSMEVGFKNLLQKLDKLLGS